MDMLSMLASVFEDRFDAAPTVGSRAPGRLEILGNHTDYNEGTVLSVAVDRATTVVAAPSGSSACCVRDITYDTERRFDADAVGEPVSGDWANYIKGLIVELGKRGIAVPGFNAVMGSTVPLSAGMSSSAALEMSMLLMLLELAGVDMDWRDMARIGQACENTYVGANTGLLDQFSSLKGRDGHLVYSDFRSLTVDTVPLPPGTALVVANSMVKHNLTNEYNERRQACEEAVSVLRTRWPDVTALRDVTLSQLRDAKGDMTDEVYRRALHVVGEIDRVSRGVRALEHDDLEAFGQCMLESQHSSTHNFENSCDEIDRLVRLSTDIPGALGARLSGGGFGGITVHLVHADAAQAYGETLAERYRAQTRLDADIMICRAAEGAALCPLNSQNAGPNS